MDEFSRILIVDDERHNIKVLSELLREEHKIMAAKSGEMALNAAHGPNPPDLILLDIMMPGLTGYEVCRKLKADPQTMHIPIIFVTALDAADDEAKGFELGAVDYISKPFKPVIVKARVRTHIHLKRKTDLLDRMASIDGLTEIPNRRNFDVTLEKELRRIARSGAFLSLILSDIDFFKKYNDHYGHAEGDTCLRRVAKAVASCASRAADFAARYGGEEFAIILPETDVNGAITIAEKIKTAVAALNIRHAASTVADHVTLSLGVATVTGNQDISPVDLIKAADAFLYKAKENGRNTVFSTSKHGTSKKNMTDMEEKYRILIVDDERFYIKTLTEFLHEDYKIMAAKNGDQALKAVEGDILPDLILLDIMMPGIDGYEVCKRLKENPKTTNIPIIFVTAVSEIEDAARGFRAGAVDFIQKPLNPIMAKARVRLHIKLHRTMQELKNALSEVKKLSGLLPICMHCKKIRDDSGYWNQIEAYIAQHSDTQFSHGICQDCVEKYYPDLDLYDEDETQQ